MDTLTVGVVAALVAGVVTLQFNVRRLITERNQYRELTGSLARELLATREALITFRKQNNV